MNKASTTFDRVHISQTPSIPPTPYGSRIEAGAGVTPRAKYSPTYYPSSEIKSSKNWSTATVGAKLPLIQSQRKYAETPLRYIPNTGFLSNSPNLRTGGETTRNLRNMQGNMSIDGLRQKRVVPIELKRRPGGSRSPECYLPDISIQS